MALHSEDKFRDDPPAGFDGQFHWDYLAEAFKRATGRPIQPMDIDAHVEIGGQHLVFETKREGVAVPNGQRRALLQLWAKGYHTIIFLWGKREPMKMEVYFPRGDRAVIENGVTVHRVAEICERWARWANSNPCPFQYADPKA